MPEGLAALSFLTDDFGRARESASAFASDVTALDVGVPGVELFFCTMGGVPIEFMGAYVPDSNEEHRDDRNS